MSRKAKSNRTKQGNTRANLGFEDKLCGNMEAAEYKHVVLGSLFNEPMRVETVQVGGLSACGDAQAGDGTWTVEFVGTQSERFHKVTLADSDIITLTILDSVFSYDGNGHLLRPGSQRTCGGKAATKDQVRQSMNTMVVTWTT
jgi:hypothetical protein